MNRSDSDLSSYSLVSNTAEMKFLFLVAVLAMAVTLIKGYTDEEQWKDFKRKYKLNYNIPSDNGREDRKRKTLFLESKKKLKEDSKVPMSFFQQLNAFSVLRPVEKQRFLGVNASLVPSDRFMESIKDEFQIKDSLPLSLDYRYDSCLTPVRNQGSCGSCWAFSAITPLEFSRCKNVNAPVVLSEQQLVDCDRTNYGCNGGWYVTAWTHLQQGSGSVKRTLYPYTARKGTCRLNNSAIEARVNTFNYVATQNAPAIQVALQKYGPIAVAMTVVNSFYNYAGGVYNDPACDGKAVNHGVVIVGWAVLNGIEAWIVRNTWGHRWGDNGYALIQRGVNKCGIETYPAYATAY